MPITFNGTSGITFPDGSTQTTRPAVGFRNRIINGDMRIDQRNAGASVTPTGNQYTLDRWFSQLSQASKYSVQRNAGSVTPPSGYSNYLGVTCLSGYSVTSSDFFAIAQAIEGYNFSDLDFGGASAKQITISFWVRSNLTGTFGGVVKNSATDRSYPFSYTISSANTWEQKNVTINGDTSGTWLTDNGVGAYILFGLGVGSTYSGTAGSWSASNYVSAAGAVNVLASTNNTFYITGVQLEAGSTATEFERRPYGTELALCQRYYWRIDGYNAISAIGSGSVYSSTTTCRIYCKYPVSMRSYPTLSMAGSLMSSGGNADNSVSAISASNAGLESTLIDFTTAAGTLGHGKVIYVASNASYGVNYIQATSEL